MSAPTMSRVAILRDFLTTEADRKAVEVDQLDREWTAKTNAHRTNPEQTPAWRVETAARALATARTQRAYVNSLLRAFPAGGS